MSPAARPAARSAPTVAVDLRALVPEATGIGVYTRELGLALARRGGCRLLGLAHRPPRGADELAAAGVRIEHQPAPLGVLWQQLRLPRRLRRGDADLFWSPLGTLPWSCPLPAVVTVHDLTPLLFPRAHTAKVRWSQIPFLERSLATARRVVADSASTARDLAFHFPETAGRTRIVHPGVAPEFRPGEADAIAALRAELDAPDGYLLSVGTLEPRKNLAALLDVWESLRAEDEGTPPLVLAGGAGWGSRDLARRIQALGAPADGGPRAVHVGRVDRERLVALLQAARLFVYPSLYEGFGLPPLEAMACGVPVVTSDSSSLPEVVGDSGLTVPPHDRAGLRQAISRLLADDGLSADLADRGRRRAAGFTWDAAAAALEEVFAEALAAPGGGAGR